MKWNKKNKSIVITIGIILLLVALFATPVGSLLLALGTLVILYVAIMLGWVLTLIRQVQKKEWIWFGFSLFVAPAFIVYWIVQLYKSLK